MASVADHPAPVPRDQGGPLANRHARSQVPGDVGGELGQGELALLAQAPGAAPELGAVFLVCLHHQPVKIGCEWLTSRWSLTPTPFRGAGPLSGCQGCCGARAPAGGPAPRRYPADGIPRRPVCSSRRAALTSGPTRRRRAIAGWTCTRMAHWLQGYPACAGVLHGRPGLRRLPVAACWASPARRNVISSPVRHIVRRIAPTARYNGALYQPHQLSLADTPRHEQLQS